MASLLTSSVSGGCVCVCVCVCVCGWVAVVQGDIIFGTGKEFSNTFPYILIAYVIILALFVKA